MLPLGAIYGSGPEIVAGLLLVAGLAHRPVNLFQLTFKRFGELQRRRQIVDATVKRTVM